MIHRGATAALQAVATDDIRCVRGIFNAIFAGSALWITGAVLYLYL